MSTTTTDICVPQYLYERLFCFEHPELLIAPVEQKRSYRITDFADFEDSPVFMHVEATPLRFRLTLTGHGVPKDSRVTFGTRIKHCLVDSEYDTPRPSPITKEDIRDILKACADNATVAEIITDIAYSFVEL
jgi:hypothetical protein